MPAFAAITAYQGQYAPLRFNDITVGGVVTSLSDCTWVVKVWSPKTEQVHLTLDSEVTPSKFDLANAEDGSIRILFSNGDMSLPSGWYHIELRPTDSSGNNVPIDNPIYRLNLQNSAFVAG